MVKLSLAWSEYSKNTASLHKMKNVLEANREILSNKSMEKMLVKELVADNDAINSFKSFYKTKIKSPGGI